MRCLATLALTFAFVPPADAQDEGFAAPVPKSPAEYIQAVQEELKTHKYFSTVLLVEDKSADPVLLFLHKPQVEKEGWQAVMAGRAAPWLKKANERFRDVFAVPLGLSRLPQTPLSIVCVLQTQGDYSNYSQKVLPQSVFGGGASFERRYHVTTGFDSGGNMSAAQRSAALVAEFARALVKEHGAASAAPPREAWIEWGISGYFGMSAGKSPQSLDAPHVEFTWLNYLFGNLENDDERFAYPFPLREIASMTSLSDASTHAKARVSSVDLELDGRFAQFVFQIQAASWFEFLLDADSGKHREGFRKYLAGAFAGHGEAKELFEALGVADDLSLDRAHIRWMIERYDAGKPKVPLGAAAADKFFRTPEKKPLAPAGSPTSASPNAPRSKTGGAAFDPRSIGLAPEDLEAEHGLALQLVRAGDVEAARPRLAVLLERARGGPSERRVERDVQRLDAFAALRERFLAHLVDSPEKHTFEVEGKKVVAKVVRVEGGFVVLGENRQKLDKLPVASLTPFVVARDLPGKLASGPEGWVKPWGFVLEGDERWKKALAGDDGPVRQLRNDAEDWIGRVVAEGVVAKALDELASAGVPKDEFDAAVCVDRIDRLVKQARESKLVTARLGSLASLAESALGLEYDPQDLERALACRIERLGGQRVRVTLGFEEPQPLRGGAKPSSVLVDLQKRSGALVTGAESRCEVANGKLRMQGATQWQSALRFRAPLDARAVVFHNGTTGEYESSFFLFAGLDSEGRYVTTTSNGCMKASASSSGGPALDWNCGPIEVEHEYTTVLHLDEGRATAIVDGANVASVPFASKSAGAVAILVHADVTIEVDELVIEGELDADSAREAWIAARRAELGL
jgi:hypothetical protein